MIFTLSLKSTPKHLAHHLHWLGLILMAMLMMVSCGSQDTSSDAASNIKDPFKEALDSQNSASSTAPTSNDGSSSVGQIAGASPSSQMFLGAHSGIGQSSSSRNSNSNGVTPTPGQDPFKTYLDAHPPGSSANANTSH